MAASDRTFLSNETTPNRLGILPLFNHNDCNHFTKFTCAFNVESLNSQLQMWVRDKPIVHIKACKFFFQVMYVHRGVARVNQV